MAINWIQFVIVVREIGGNFNWLRFIGHFGWCILIPVTVHLVRMLVYSIWRRLMLDIVFQVLIRILLIAICVGIWPLFSLQFVCFDASFDGFWLKMYRIVRIKNVCKWKTNESNLISNLHRPAIARQSRSPYNFSNAAMWWHFVA